VQLKVDNENFINLILEKLVVTGEYLN